MSSTKRNVALVLGLAVTLAAVAFFSLSDSSESSAANNNNEVVHRVARDRPRADCALTRGWTGSSCSQLLGHIGRTRGA